MFVFIIFFQASQIIQQLSLDNKLAIESIDKLKIEKECLKMETKKLEDQNDDITRNYVNNLFSIFIKNF